MDMSHVETGNKCKKRLVSLLARGTVGAALTLAAGSLQAGLVESSWSFSGSDRGGSLTADMGITIDDVANSLTLVLDNTSSPLLDDGSGPNAPGIVGFGFNLDPDLAWSSWDLTAYSTGNPQTTAPITIGSSNDSSLLWSLLEDTNNQGIRVDYNPDNGTSVNGALFSPDASGGLPGGSNTSYFTQAVFTINFDETPILASQSCGSGLECTTFVRAQNVGTGGSLKLAGTGGGPNPPQEVPAPGTLLLIGLGLLGLRRYRGQA